MDFWTIALLAGIIYLAVGHILNYWAVSRYDQGIILSHMVGAMIWIVVLPILIYDFVSRFIYDSASRRHVHKG